MRKAIIGMLVAALALVLSGCADAEIEVSGDVLAFAYTGKKSPIGSACYLAFADGEGKIQQSIQLGPHFPASATYADPYIFVPMYMNIKGTHDITKWVYYVNTYSSEQGRFEVAWQPLQVLPYKDCYVVISAMHGSEVCVQLLDQDFEMQQEAILKEELFAKGPFILDRYLFASTGWGVSRFDLENNLATDYIELPGRISGVSIAEWNGKIIATDLATTIWLIEPESLEVEKLDNLPSRQGHGVSLVVGDWLMVGDTYSENATIYNLVTKETRHLVFEDWISHLSLIDDLVIVSHNRGRTIVDSNWEIVDVQSITDGRGLTNFVKINLP